ncbi:MAG: sigma factor [bacterium]
MLNKYKGVIWKRIKSINTPLYTQDDLFQECFLLLIGCIDTFDANRNVLFYTYVTVIFSRRINKLLSIHYKEKSVVDYLVYEKQRVLREQPFDCYDVLSKASVTQHVDRLFKRLSAFERLVLTEIMIGGMTKEDFVVKYDTNIRRIYNTYHAIRTKFAILLNSEGIK